MDDARFDRMGWIGGPIFVALGLIATFLPGRPPDVDAPAPEIVAFYADNDSSIQLASWLGLIGAVFIAIWFCSLWRAMVDAEGGTSRLSVVALVGLVLAGASVFTWRSLNAATAMNVDSIGGATEFFYGLVVVLQAASAIGLAILLLAVSILALRSPGFLPEWLAWVGLVVTAALAVASVAVMSDSASWSTVGLVAVLGWFVWILAVSAFRYHAQAPSARASATSPI